MAISLTRL